MSDRTYSTKVNVVMVHRRCLNESCRGEMVATGLGNQHKCDSCGLMEDLPAGSGYPYIRFEDTKEPA